MIGLIEQREKVRLLSQKLEQLTSVAIVEETPAAIWEFWQIYKEHRVNELLLREMEMHQ